MELKVGEKIRTLRKESGMSQTKLAEMLSTTQDTISLWELGKSYPCLPDLVMLTKIFNVSADYLLDINEF